MSVFARTGKDLRIRTSRHFVESKCQSLDFGINSATTPGCGGPRNPIPRITRRNTLMSPIGFEDFENELKVEQQKFDFTPKKNILGDLWRLSKRTSKNETKRCYRDLAYPIFCESTTESQFMEHFYGNQLCSIRLYVFMYLVMTVFFGLFRSLTDQEVGRFDYVLSLIYFTITFYTISASILVVLTALLCIPYVYKRKLTGEMITFFFLLAVEIIFFIYNSVIVSDSSSLFLFLTVILRFNFLSMRFVVHLILTMLNLISFLIIYFANSKFTSFCEMNYEVFLLCIVLLMKTYFHENFTRRSFMKRRKREQVKKKIVRLFEIRVRLLRKIIPRPFFKQWKIGKKMTYRKYKNVAVQVVRFSNMLEFSSTISANILIRFMKEIYSEFDNVCREKAGVEKIKSFEGEYVSLQWRTRKAFELLEFGICVVGIFQKFKKLRNFDKIGIQCGIGHGEALSYVFILDDQRSNPKEKILGKGSRLSFGILGRALDEARVMAEDSFNNVVVCPALVAKSRKSGRVKFLEKSGEYPIVENVGSPQKDDCRRKRIPMFQNPRGPRGRRGSVVAEIGSLPKTPPKNDDEEENLPNTTANNTNRKNFFDDSSSEEDEKYSSNDPFLEDILQNENVKSSKSRSLFSKIFFRCLLCTCFCRKILKIPTLSEIKTTMGMNKELARSSRNISFLYVLMSILVDISQVVRYSHTTGNPHSESVRDVLAYTFLGWFILTVFTRIVYCCVVCNCCCRRFLLFVSFEILLLSMQIVTLSFWIIFYVLTETECEWYFPACIILMFLYFELSLHIPTFLKLLLSSCSLLLLLVIFVVHSPHEHTEIAMTQSVASSFCIIIVIEVYLLIKVYFKPFHSLQHFISQSIKTKKTIQLLSMETEKSRNLMNSLLSESRADELMRNENNLLDKFFFHQNSTICMVEIQNLNTLFSPAIVVNRKRTTKNAIRLLFNLLNSWDGLVRDKKKDLRIYSSGVNYSIISGLKTTCRSFNNTCNFMDDAPSPLPRSSLSPEVNKYNKKRRRTKMSGFYRRGMEELDIIHVLELALDILESFEVTKKEFLTSVVGSRNKGSGTGARFNDVGVKIVVYNGNFLPKNGVCSGIVGNDIYSWNMFGSCIQNCKHLLQSSRLSCVQLVSPILKNFVMTRNSGIEDREKKPFVVLGDELIELPREERKVLVNRFFVRRNGTGKSYEVPTPPSSLGIVGLKNSLGDYKFGEVANAQEEEEEEEENYSSTSSNNTTIEEEENYSSTSSNNTTIEEEEEEKAKNEEEIVIKIEVL